MKIGIIGMGRVGTSIAVAILQQGVARELLLHDLQGELAEGEALDLAHGAAFYPAASVRVATVDDMRACDAVVIAAGRNGRADESRLDLLRDNARVIGELAGRLSGLAGLLVIVSNPVDILTQIATHASGLPPARVLGTGTLLDTARLRQVVGRELSVDPRSVHALVLGEHGDTEVVAWSAAQVAGAALRRWPSWTRDRETAIATEVRRAAYEIIRRKGATNHAIGLATAGLLRWALRDERRAITVSRVQEGVAGIRDVALSLPAIIGSAGAVTVIEPDLDDTERAGLHASAAALRQAHAAL
ncbi:MAG: L-lactate dehydrogenase [Myxococcota bacterium]|nr:L-lactate dehydrogenase [Myxococcota bacterium]